MAGEKTFSFEILTLQKSFLREEIRFAIAPGLEGLFEILPGHAPYVFALKPGSLQMRMPDGKDQHVAVGAGFLCVQRDRTTVLTRSAERPDEIDRSRAERAKERALQRLANRRSIDEGRAQTALQRALARLKVAEYSKSES